MNADQRVMDALVPQPSSDIVDFPLELADRYRQEGLWRDRTIAEELHETAIRFPSHLALLGTTVSLTYAELDQQTDRVAAGLAMLGLRPGDRVLLQMTNHAATVIAWYALLKAGLVPIASLITHRRHELSEIARLARPVAHVVEPAYGGHDLVSLAKEIATAEPSLRHVLTVGVAAGGDGTTALLELGQEVDSAAARRIVEGIQHSIDPTSLAVLQLSGGTTSTPKLIPRLHAEYWFNSRAYAEALELGPEGQVAHLLPIVHNAGIVCALHAAHSVGASVAIADHDEREFTTLAKRGRITHMLMSPPMAAIVMANDALREALATMKVLTWVLGPVPKDLLATFDSGSSRVTQMFGMGEGLCMFTPLAVPAELRTTSVGTPLSSFDEVRVFHPGTEVPARVGEPGELCCRGPYTIRGYYRAPERNAEAFTAEGFYRTGDIVVELQSVEGRRYFALSDRIKDVVNRGGEKINAVEVEELLSRHPSIMQAAVVAMPDARLGERACAFLTLNEGVETLDLEQLREFLDELGVAKFKCPERVEIRDHLPMTSVTKVKKVALREEIAAILEQERASK